MAKKLNINFTGQPITGVVGFSYEITIAGLNLYYGNGDTNLRVNFLNNGATPTNYYEIPIGVSLDETLQILLTFLRETYQNELVAYSLTDTGIEVLIQADAVVTIGETLNANITITQTDVEPAGENLIYYLIFDNYVLNIYKKNYLGSATEINGSFSIKKSSVDTILTPIRGTALQLSLEANPNITFDDFILNDEFTFKTELLKDNQLIFKGYIKPDGIQQNYVYDNWIVNIESSDNLGALKDLSFVQSNGLRFTGKLSLYDVIKGCLDRTKLDMVINTSINLEYVGYSGSNILKDVYVKADRFIKNKDDSVIMDCNEVLTSTLNLMSAVITQQDGQWWIYRPNDLEATGYTTFINQSTNTTFTKNLNYDLGSQINNFYPHHSGANQQIEVKGAISAYRLNYEYGFLDGFVLNPNLNHNDEMVFDNWTTSEGLPEEVQIINNGLPSGLELKIDTGAPFPTEVLTSDEFPVFENQILTFRAKVASKNVLTSFIFKIKTSTGLYLNRNGSWVTDSDAYVFVNCGAYSYTEYSTTYELVMPPIPVDCDLRVIICAPRTLLPFGAEYRSGVAKVNYIQVLDNELQKNGIVGEFHTVTRFNPPSSITKENQKVYNGDGGFILIGSMYKSDQTTLTEFWTRKNKFENLPLLGISAMDDLRIQSNAIKVFSGDIYGQIPYMSVIKIDNIDGLFMFIEYEYDYKSNILFAKLLQFYNTDLADIQYTISPDYGNNTIKPTIKG